ncbi:MAG: hypothetical protein HOA17_06125 [Candidatus Melainabacteria bacterium]|nr:hypothetical protein [Candidatus Melainabacteria bacterium]
MEAFTTALRRSALSLIPGGGLVNASIEATDWQQIKDSTKQILEQSFKPKQKEIAQSKVTEVIIQKPENKELKDKSPKKIQRARVSKSDNNLLQKLWYEQQNYYHEMVEQMDKARQQAQEYLKRTREQHEERRTAEATRQKESEPKHNCNDLCDSKRRLLKLASRYGVAVEANLLTLSTSDLEQTIKARIQHNIIGFIAFAKENPSLGYNRALREYASNSIDSSVRELVANDVQLGASSDILNPHERSLAQV